MTTPKDAGECGTPRTDEAIVKVGPSHCYRAGFTLVEPSFARQLERELIAARAELAEVRRKCMELIEQWNRDADLSEDNGEESALISCSSKLRKAVGAAGST